jgi:hypothetical protein
MREERHLSRCSCAPAIGHSALGRWGLKEGRSFATPHHHMRITTCGSMTEKPTSATRQSRIHRGHRIVAVQLGNDWFGTVRSG